MAAPQPCANPLRCLTILLNAPLLAAALLAAALPALIATPALAAPAPAAVIGAQPFDRGEMGLWANLGVPDVELGARWGLSSAADLGARLRLSYGTGSHLGGFGSSAALLARLRVAQWGGWDVALAAEPGVLVHAGVQDWAPLAKAGQKGATTALLGVDLGVPAVLASTQLPGDLRLALGLAAPAQIQFSPETTLVWQVVARAQLAKAVDQRWSALVGAESGTVFYGPGAGAPTAEPLWRLHVGVSWQ